MNAAPLNDLWLDEMPHDWQRSRIRNVAVLSPSYSKTRPASDEHCTVVPMELLSNDGVIDVTNQQPLEDIPTGLPLFEKGDVLFAKITPCMENGKGAFVRQLPTRYAFGSTEFHVLRAGNRVDGNSCITPLSIPFTGPMQQKTWSERLAKSVYPLAF